MKAADLVQIAQVVGAVAASGAAIFAARQMTQARRTAVLQSLQEFFKTVSERERALVSANTEEDREHAFVELLNFLEVYSAAHNGWLLQGASKALVGDKLIEAVVALEHSPHWHPRIEAAITSHTTFTSLAKFIARNRKAVHAKRLTFQMAPPQQSV
jgi:hypothetical protein